MKTLDRRAWLKRGALTAAGAIAAPYLSYGAFGNEPVTIDAQGNLPYTPFFKEWAVEGGIHLEIVHKSARAWPARTS